MKNSKAIRAAAKKKNAGYRSDAERWLAVSVPVGIFLVTVTAFFPALQNGFVNWDDDKNLLENPHYRGLGWTQLYWMFTTFDLGHYQPLSWTSFGLDYLLWGMKPFGYHLTSLILHGANAVLVYLLSRRLLSFSFRLPVDERTLQLSAGFAALLFALHPLRVESVAWATERRDVLSGFFYLLTVLCYLRAATAPGISRWRWMAGSLIAFSLSLLSKAAGMTLPVVLLVLDFYPLRRLGGGPGKWFGRAARRVWWGKAPFLILAMVFALVALLAQHDAGALTSLERYSLLSRFVQAFFGFVFYLWKTLWPLGLSPLYEAPASLDPFAARYLGATLVVLAVSAALLALRRSWPAGLAVWIAYLVTLAPVSGIAQSGVQLVADRYSYLSCLGLAALAGGGLLWAVRLSRQARLIALGLAGLALAGLAVLTWRQAQVWHDTETLWRYVLTFDPGSSVAHNNMGTTLFKRGKLEEAVHHYRAALQINPTYAVAHHNLGNALADRGELDEAIRQYREALEFDPKLAQAHYSLGDVLATQGNLAQAIEQFRMALQLDPALADAYYKLGNAFAVKGDADQAIQNYRSALDHEPTHALAHFNLGNALVRRGRLDESMAHFEAALKLQPNLVDAYHNLGRLAAAQGQLDRAVQLFREALRINPAFAEAHQSLAMALAEQGKRDEAAKHYEDALRIIKSRPASKAVP